jgi:hypothetical protein
MKHFVDPNTNELYAYESDGSQDEFIKQGLTPVTDSEAISIRQANERLKFDSFSYSEKRMSEYPDFRNYLDGVVKGDQAQIDAYIAACQAVKAKYPKP